MADRMRQMMKRSTSKLSTSKGSVHHIGTTPYRFKVDIFISYAENIKNLTDACITCERRGKVYSTDVVSIKDGKAIFRQVISMECTLFRKTPPKSKRDNSEPNLSEQFDFDEKKAKVCLRKSGPQGKVVAKLALNISDYVKGASSTVFADMKLSDGTLVVTKVEATMLAMEKKKKKGSCAGSDIASEMSDAQSVDDSLFDDEEDLQYAQRMADIPLDEPSSSASASANIPPEMSPVSFSTCIPSTRCSFSKEDSVQTATSSCVGEDRRDKCTSNKHSQSNGTMLLHSSGSSGVTQSPVTVEEEKQPPLSMKTMAQMVNQESQIKESPSLKEKLRNKLKSKKEKPERKDKDRSHKSDKRKHDAPTEAEQSETEAAVMRNDYKAEIKELKKALECMKKENSKLKKAKNAAMEEVEALRAELKSCELALDRREHTGGNSPRVSIIDIANLEKKVKEKDKKIGELTSQNESLMDEMEEQHQELRTMRTMTAKDVESVERDGDEVNALKTKIRELEVSLRREPEFIDVVNELKVIKVTLALANMEKEQAIFELQSYRQMSTRTVMPAEVSSSED